MLTRDFTVATFVIRGSEVILLRHRKLGLWLPPGGHIDPGELPDEAAIREVKEEAGIDCQLIGERGIRRDATGLIASPRGLTRPAGVQLETIGPDHEHIDLIYFALPLDPKAVPEGDENEAVGYYPIDSLETVGAPIDVCLWARRAEREARRISHGDRLGNAEEEGERLR